MGFGEKLQKWLVESGRTKADLARSIGVSAMAVQHWTRGSEPGTKALLALSRVTGLPMEYWADDSSDSPPPEPTPDEATLADLVRRLGVSEVIRRTLKEEGRSSPPDVEVVRDPPRGHRGAG